MIVGRLEAAIKLAYGFYPQLDSLLYATSARVALFCPHYPQLGMVRGDCS